jgi:hypothetical protein
MKVIAFEEHYKIHAIAQANKDNPIEQIYEKWQQLGRFPGNPSQGVPPGIYDLDDKRIAAMDGSMKAARQCFDQMPIDENDKKKIGYLNAERLLGISFEAERELARTA